MKITTIGLDIAKTIFHMFAVNQAGKLVKKRAIKRADLLSVFARLEPTLIVMEACGGANHWAREFIKLGHQVKLIAPQYVVPYRRKNKNDFNDAEAIAEAAQRPNMTFVPIKSVEQEDIQMVLRIRKRHVKTMVAINNQVRGFLAEYGLCAAKGKTALAARLPEFIDDESNELSAFARESFRELYADFVAAQEKVEFYTKKINVYTRNNPICKRVKSVIGVGPMTAAELYASIGDGKMFHNGRHFAAWCGLTQRQNSSGGKTMLSGITKKGNPHLRSSLIHGARAALQYVDGKDDKLSRWAYELKCRKHSNVACVALANKLARIAWSVIANEEDYRLEYVA